MARKVKGKKTTGKKAAKGKVKPKALPAVKPKSKRNATTLKPGDKIAKKVLSNDFWEQVNALLSIGCTGDEIAEVQGLHYNTISNRCEQEQGMPFCDYIKKHHSNFKTSLRRAQFRSALGWKDTNGRYFPPSTTMQIWLGKQHLGQTDKHEVQLPAETDISLDLGRKLPGDKDTTDEF